MSQPSQNIEDSDSEETNFNVLTISLNPKLEKSFVWKYFGFLKRNGKIMDDSKYYCSPCLDNKKLKL